MTLHVASTFTVDAGASSSSTVGFVSNFIKSTFKSNDETGDRKVSVTSDQASGEELIFLSPPLLHPLRICCIEIIHFYPTPADQSIKLTQFDILHAHRCCSTLTEEAPTSSPKGFVSNIFKNPFKSTGDKDSDRKDSTSSTTESNKGQWSESYSSFYN